MKYFRTVRDSSQKDLLSLANLSIITINKMVYLLLAILTIIIFVLGFYGLGSIRDAEENYRTKIEKPIEDIKAIAIESGLLKDSLKVILSEVKQIESSVKNSSILAKNSLNQSNIIYDSLKLRLRDTNELENSITKFNSELLIISNEFKSQNKQILLLSNIFNNVAAQNQDILDFRERLLMYLLAYQVEKQKDNENRNLTLIFNLGRMLFETKNYSEPKFRHRRKKGNIFSIRVAINHFQ